MRVLEGEHVLVRIIVGDSDVWNGQPLHQALLERLRAEGFAGATVIRGSAGFGARSRSASADELASDLPVLVEVVDDHAHVDRIMPILDEMLTGGALVTMENVRVVRYARVTGSDT